MAAMSRDEAFAEIAWHAIQALGLAETISRIVQFVRRATDADAAGVTMINSDDQFEGIGETTSAVRRSDDLQYRIREGPCVNAAIGLHDVTSPDLAVDHRWPRWSPRAVDLGLRSVLSIALHTAGNRRLGALNLYGYTTRQFTSTDREAARPFAEHAAAALAATIDLDELIAGVPDHARIGQATGIVMEHYDLDADQAVALLTRYSRQADIGLTDLARGIVNRRRLPTPPTS